MSRPIYSFLLALPLCALAAACSRGEADAPKPGDRVARGKYIVESVAMCSDCHSPRGPDGNFVTEKWLQGGPLAFKPALPMPWAEYAPSIAGLAHYSDAELMSLLTQGHFQDGRLLRPPMPAFRLNEEDAQAVVAYLRSLAPAA